MVEFIEDHEGSVESWIANNIDLRHAPESYANFDRVYADLLDFLVSPDP
jgi:hypothetical protein